MPDDSAGTSNSLSTLCGPRIVKKIEDLTTGTVSPGFISIVDGATDWDAKNIVI